MSLIKLSDVLKSKNPGDTWQSILSPEQYRFWNLQNKWDEDEFRKYGLKLLSIKIRGSVAEEKSTERFKFKEPLYLNCGVDIRKGFVTTSASKNAGFSIRIDSIIELNQALAELSNKFGFSQWELTQLELYNEDEGCIVKFALHNPDGNGTNLSFWSVTISKEETLYPEISYFDQQRYCKKFQSNFAHCVCEEAKIKIHGCAVQKKKRANVIARKAKKIIDSLKKREENNK